MNGSMMRRLRLAATALACMALGAVPALAQKRIIVDTDMGPDDWIAIAYLAQHPGVELLGVTIAGNGLAPCPYAALNAKYLLGLSPRTAGLPVGCGAHFPMDGVASYPTAWRAGAIGMLGEKMPEQAPQASVEDSGALLARLLRQSAEPVEILTIGAMSNLGALLRAEPALAAKIRQVTAMAGAVYTPGNLRVHGFTDDHANQRAEWNVYIDPVAAQLVFDSAIPLRIVPLDATNKAPLRKPFVERIEKTANGPMGSFVSRTFARIASATDNGEYFHWDPLAAAVAADPALCDRVERKPMTVIADKGMDAGVKPGLAPAAFPLLNAFGERRSPLDATAAGATVEAQTGRPVELCLHVALEKFEDEFAKLMAKPQ